MSNLTFEWQGKKLTAQWLSESGAPVPARLFDADDRTTADEALKRVKRGESLLYRGDFRNAQQLLAALGRRLAKPVRGATLKERFVADRRAKSEEATVLGRLLVPLGEGCAPLLPRSPPGLAQACAEAFGPASGPTVLSLRELQGALGAAEWRKKGVEVKALGARIHPHYGVFTPTRQEYVELVALAPSLKGKRCMDLGTGSGVLALLLAKKGALSVVASDVDPRAVACAKENLARFKFKDRITVEQADLFPPGKADVVLFNPPWLPGEPKTALDKAIYDPGGQLLARYLEGLADHLTPGGEGWLVLSDLAERLGLRAPGELAGQFAEAGLDVVDTLATTPTHGRSKDSTDPLYAARSEEVTRLYRLRPR